MSYLFQQFGIDIKAKKSKLQTLPLLAKRSRTGYVVVSLGTCVLPGRAQFHNIFHSRIFYKHGALEDWPIIELCDCLASSMPTLCCIAKDRSSYALIYRRKLRLHNNSRIDQKFESKYRRPTDFSSCLSFVSSTPFLYLMSEIYD